MPVNMTASLHQLSLNLAIDMSLRTQYLINEIINVVPATKSLHYVKQQNAINRLNELKAELTTSIENLEKISTQPKDTK